MQYKWEAYCDTNGGSTDSISLSLEPRRTKSTAIQIGGVLQYKWEVYCDTFLRSSAGWGFRHSSDLSMGSTCLVRVSLQGDSPVARWSDPASVQFPPPPPVHVFWSVPLSLTENKRAFNSIARIRGQFYTRPPPCP